MDGGLYFDGVIGALTSCGGTGRPTGGDCVDYSGSDGVEILNLSGLTMGLSDRCMTTCRRHDTAHRRRL